MCLSSVLLPQIPAMSSLSALFSVLCEHPYVSAILDINGCISFLELVRLIKPDLELHLRPGDIGPMERLTLAAHGFLVDCLGLKSEDMKLIWYTLRDVAWGQEPLSHEERDSLGRRYIQKFLDHGHHQGICMYSTIWNTEVSDFPLTNLITP
jgi:hypothetical protein